MQVFPESMTLPPETLTGRGSIARLLPSAAGHGRSGVLVHGVSLARSGRLDTIMAGAPAGIRIHTHPHTGGEPTLCQVEALRAFILETQAAWVTAVGGGSVIDLAKAAAGLAQAEGSAEQYHEGATIPDAGIPFFAAPTTAGTGSEATIVSVLTNTKTGVKKSFRHPSHMARLVVLDPDLLAGSPPSVIAASGMDAFTQAVESFTSRGATWFTDQLALKATVLIGSSIRDVYEDSTADQAEDLLYGSYLAGLALSNARLGIVHGLAHPLGARYHVPHGTACAVCLPFAIEFNRTACEAKYDRLSTVLGTDLSDFVEELLDAMDIVNPFTGQSLDDLASIVDETLASGSTKANPREAQAEDVERLLTEIFGQLRMPQDPAGFS